MRFVLHMTLHFLVPAVVAKWGVKECFLKAWLIMLAAFVIDIDHVLARPLLDPNRCSIGFHPLHTWQAAVLFTLFLYFPKTRLFGIGLFIHLALDTLDCWLMKG